MKAGAKGGVLDALVDCSLERAIHAGNVELVKLLITHRRCLDEVGVETGKRPLELARERGHTIIANLLKKAGAHE